MTEEEIVVEEDTRDLGLVDLMHEGDPCNSNLVLNKLKTFRLWSDKKKFIDTTFDKCAATKNKSSNKTKKKGKKRAMSGYNCFMKQCAKGKSFQNCLQEKGWGKLEQNKKDNYNEMARNGCS